MYVMWKQHNKSNMSYHFSPEQAMVNWEECSSHAKNTGMKLKTAYTSVVRSAFAFSEKATTSQDPHCQTQKIMKWKGTYKDLPA